jgi:uncharacterized membrane protein
MIAWGALWGALCGLVSGRFDGENLILGAAIGALAGWSLRRAVDRRIAQRLAGRETKAPAAVALPTPAFEAPAPARSASPAPAVEATPAAAHPRPAEEAPPTIPLQPAARTARPLTASEIAVERIKSWLLGGNTVARLGALVFFIGLAFLARFAAEQGLFPPQLRLAGIGLVAIVLLVLGFRLRERRSGYSLTLQGVGVAILYLNIFAALRLYGFIAPLPAFALMVALCALSALLAVLQDSRALAVIGAAGGFVTPILVSTGQGDHVALFSYYTVLNLGILGIAWKKDWRALNLVGFVFTFGIATMWGVLRFVPANYASTQPFLAVFFLLYVAIAVLFALRRSPMLTDTVDATLVFGVPLIGFGLQAGLVRNFEYGLAWSALAVAAFYLGFAALLAQRRLEQLRLLFECFIALGVIFASLAIAFALEARWTAAAWALEGAAVGWVGARQERRLARAFGLLLQVGAALAFVRHLGFRPPQQWPLANADFIGAVLLAGAATFCGRLISQRAERYVKGHGWDEFERALGAPVALYGFAWWMVAIVLELTRHYYGARGTLEFAVDPLDRLFPLMAAYVLSAGVACHFGHKRRWNVATWPAYASLPVMLLAALAGLLIYRHVFEHLGWVCWPLAIAAHLHTLRTIDVSAHRWFVAVHAGGVYLLVLLAGSLGVDLIDRAELWNTSWGPAASLAALAAVLFAITHAATSPAAQARWPMNRYARAYGWFGLLPVAGLAVAGALASALTQRGDATPLPHVPLLNPTDLSVLLALAAAWQWKARSAAMDWKLPATMRAEAAWIATIGALLFVWLNTVWLRIAHHFFGVGWDAVRLFESFVVQTGCALLWTATAMALMLFASRRRLRAPWLTGAALLGATVLKLFVIDLANTGGTERIVAFIGVGALMLLVGYVAPLPPAASAAKQPEAT